MVDGPPVQSDPDGPSSTLGGEPHVVKPIVPVPGAPRCVQHAEQIAPYVCSRCGNFLCARCSVPSPWADLRRFCVECLGRLGASGGGPIPWEDRTLPPVTRYWQTFAEVLLHPGRFAERMPPRGYLPAITFLYNTWAYAFPLQILVFWLSTRGMTLPSRLGSGNMMGMMVAMTFAMAFIAPILQFVSAGWLHVHLAMFGARSGFEATYRLTSYLTAVSIPYLLFAAIGIGVRSKELSVVLLLCFALYMLVLLVVTAAKVQRIHFAAAIFAVLLVVLEVVFLWRFVLYEAVRGMSRMGGFRF